MHRALCSLRSRYIVLTAQLTFSESSTPTNIHWDAQASRTSAITPEPLIHYPEQLTKPNLSNLTSNEQELHLICSRGPCNYVHDIGHNSCPAVAVAPNRAGARRRLTPSGPCSDLEHVVASKGAGNSGTIVHDRRSFCMSLSCPWVFRDLQYDPAPGHPGQYHPFIATLTRTLFTHARHGLGGNLLGKDSELWDEGCATQRRDLPSSPTALGRLIGAGHIISERSKRPRPGRG